MKSLKGIIFVLAVSWLVMACYTLAQGAVNSESSAEAGTQPVLPTPSESTEPVPTPSSVQVVSSAADELVVIEDVAVQEPALPGIHRKIVSTLIGAKSSNVLVIPDTEIKAEDVAAITQDMQVMSHIFDKIFQGPRLDEGMFRDYGEIFGRGSRATQAIYLQGYGTLFLLEVDFPFSPPPESTTKQEQPEETDSVWQQARQELFYPSQFTKVRPSEGKYDAQKVKELKSRIIKSLKHAANIRNIKPEEWIILTVHGAGRKNSGFVTIHSQNMSKSISSSRGTGYGSAYGFGGGAGGGGGMMMGPDQKQPSQGSVMTIRAKKSDVDDYAGGKLDLEQFKEKVQILVY